MPTSHARLAAVIIDCLDPEALATFWCGLLGLHVASRLGDPAQYVDCSPFGGDAYLGFQRVDQLPMNKSRLHVDIDPEDVEAVTSWIEGHGGRRSPIGDVDEHGERWRVMLDPEGNEFCVWQSADEPRSAKGGTS